ncbi:Bromodomain associated-domain-containing protein [Cercophora scortea]|uniref:Transcription initiation factor TFIID subunit 8 n=1 Tax=Cercophora scortea TaxID=314031 RepID=A0AAE0MHE3_9PEZI|nr:Bromodomain associated-domain-containing protein [Cercophora scortea]
MAPESRTESRKRAAEAQDDQPHAKRQRTASPYTILAIDKPPAALPHASPIPTSDELAKNGLRRGVALILQKVGFDSAKPEAVESLVVMVETYLESLAQDVKTYANAARRSYPVPQDFENTLQRHNLSLASLQPHKKPPIPKSRRLPVWEPLPENEIIATDLPVLGVELDGAPDKTSKDYIPGAFPAFPSIHTYRRTPESVEAFTVAEDWLSFSADESQSQSQTQVQSQATQKPQSQKSRPPLAPDEIPRGDPKKMREAAAKEAKAGEAALRGLMRASKVAKQQELRRAVQNEPVRRARQELWESAMVDLIEENTRPKGKDAPPPPALHGPQKREEIADHSTVVNAETRYYRREIPRSGARKVMPEGVMGK